MRLKNLFKDLVVIGSILALSACSAPGHKGPGQEGGAYDANGGAQASGVGQGSNFGDQAGGPQ